MLAQYLDTGHVIPGTLLHRILALKVSPVKAAFSKSLLQTAEPVCDGVVDSLRYNIVRPIASLSAARF